jgi:hypothetical protein
MWGWSDSWDLEKVREEVVVAYFIAYYLYAGTHPEEPRKTTKSRNQDIRCDLLYIDSESFTEFGRIKTYFPILSPTILY